MTPSKSSASTVLGGENAEAAAAMQQARQRGAALDEDPLHREGRAAAGAEASDMRTTLEKKRACGRAGA